MDEEQQPLSYVVEGRQRDRRVEILEIVVARGAILREEGDKAGILDHDRLGSALRSAGEHKCADHFRSNIDGQRIEQVALSLVPDLLEVY